MKGENMLPEFKEFPKIARLNREIVITEKIDGTNGIVHVAEDGTVTAGSRTRWITPQNDNHQFAAWVEANKEELKRLGVGYHYGEWWGTGIQRGYGLFEKRFSLFNVRKWSYIILRDMGIHCCRIVPVLAEGLFCENTIDECILNLKLHGSIAAPGFMKPEGIVIYHTTSRQSFKVTLENDSEPKSKKTN